MTESHRIQCGTDETGQPYTRFICTALIGADCRSWCAVGCEEYCTQPPYRIPQQDGIAVIVGHPWTDSGECRVAAWLNEAGTPEELCMDDEDEPFHSGPIEAEWTGALYVWHYAAA